MQFARRRGDDLPALMRRTAAPVGQDAPCPFDDGNQGLHIEGFEAGFDHEIELSCGEKRIGVSVHAIAHEPDRLPDVVENLRFAA